MKPTVRGTLTRSLAAVALVLLYGLSTIGISSFITGVPKAEAGGRRGGHRGGRGFRGRGGGRGFRGGRAGFWWGGPALYSSYYYDDSCYWSPRRGRYVCPYSYYPDYYRYW
jgi:hypothetical protein